MAGGTVNKVILIGRLGADPDVRYLQDGSPVVKFNMATNERVRAGEGNWEDRPEWHRVVAFGKLAENCGNYLNKGKLVYVEGRLQTRQWEDAQGVKRYTTEIVARDVQFLSAAGDRQPQAQANQSGMKSDSYQSYDDQSLSEELPPAPDKPHEDVPF
jgi:single-strand DNA-binding protein